ncbi:hypothetical protein MNBD_UNCLBAC01-591 [hydrothermal vent metagenome]|uniref:Beta-ketoacyl synthase-like N-terminal domain-containing protein n=1 Tax=hydrothermal vent metagenome TaxID=652676 RepID=A0A3B1E5I6_9ZZZZ
MNIIGIGQVSSRGRGVESFKDALEEGAVAPSLEKFSKFSEKSIPVYSIDDTLLKDKHVLSKARRADRFSKIATLAAWDAVHDGGSLESIKDESLGIIVATAFGPHKATFNFLDNILDYGESGVSPTIFSHSVHNAAASYIAAALDKKGPILTITDFCFSFHQALILADSWLDQGRCKNVLVGTVDELSSAMKYICTRKLNMDDSQTVLGEGSVFFLLTKDDSKKRYCEINQVDVSEKNIVESTPDFYIFENDGMINNQTAYKSFDIGRAFVFNCVPIVGGLMTASSFHCMAGAIMLKNQKNYSHPVNPINIEKIQCVKFGCKLEKAIINLIK